MRSTKTLRVLANPWLHIHVYADGVPRPVAAVAVDMAEHVPAPNRYVGARPANAVELQKQVSQRIGTKTVIAQRARHDLCWTFATEPEVIPNTAYYRDRLRSRELIAADADTAKAAGIEFVEPAVVLAEERAKAVAAFDAAHGAGAFDESQPAPEAAPTEPAPEPVAPVEAPKAHTTRKQKD